MLHKTDIQERNEIRQELESQIQEYLAGGGRINRRPQGECAIPSDMSIDGMRNLSGQKAFEQEIRARIARFEGDAYDE